MRPSEVIKHQAYRLKATVGHRVLIDALMNEPDQTEEGKKDFKNVCSLLHITQFDRLTDLCTQLDLTKREVISMALTEFIPRAEDWVAEIDPFEKFPPAAAKE